MQTVKKVGRVTIKEHGGYCYLHYTDPTISDPKRQRVRKSFGPSLMYAEAKAGAINDRIVRGLAGYPVDENRTVKEIMEEYIELSAINTAPKTVIRRRNCYDHWIRYMDEHGIVSASDLTPKAIERYKGWRKSKVKTRTINYELAFIKSCFINVTGNNPFKSVKKLKEIDAGRFRPLTKEEYQKVEAAASKEFRPYLIGYVQTGARRKELYAVEWPDCDFANDEIILQNFKSHRTDRIPMTPILKNLLLSLRRKGLKRPWPIPPGKNWLARHLDYAVKKAGIDSHFRIHDLRHTCGTWLAIDGASLPQLQAWLRHKDIKSTMIYIRFMPSDLRRLTAMLDPETKKSPPPEDESGDEKE